MSISSSADGTDDTGQCRETGDHAANNHPLFIWRCFRRQMPRHGPEKPHRANRLICLRSSDSEKQKRYKQRLGKQNGQGKPFCAMAQRDDDIAQMFRNT